MQVTGYEKMASELNGAFLRWGYEHRGIATYLNEVRSLSTTSHTISPPLNPVLDPVLRPAAAARPVGS